MAQWTGQFTGLTHLSKVQKREHLLRHAIDVYRSKQTPSERDSQMKTVLRLAEQLFDARLRALKARIAAQGPRDSEREMQSRESVDQFIERGIVAVLAEFGIENDKS